MLSCGYRNLTEFRREGVAGTSLRQRMYRERLKEDVLKYYSNGAMECANPFGIHEGPFTIFDALTIDHPNDDGNEHRKQIQRKGGTSFYRWLKQNGYPNGFQVLCQNCQMMKEVRRRRVQSKYSSYIPSPRLVAKHLPRYGGIFSLCCVCHFRPRSDKYAKEMCVECGRRDANSRYYMKKAFGTGRTSVPMVHK